MPIVEMRESIGSFDVKFLNDQERVQVVQKRINLKQGSLQRNMLAMDLFFDDPPQIIGSEQPIRFPGVIEFLVTPTPIFLTKESILIQPRRSMDASNTNVLYKEIIYPPTLTGSTTIDYQFFQFPQSFIASNANFPFYHDQLYLTMVFHAAEKNDIDYPFFCRFAATVYLSYNEKKIPAVRSAMGVISERFNSMIGELVTDGRIMQRKLDLQGDTIPSYQWGGIRPELMVSGQNLTTYWLKQDGQEAETMQTTTSLRTIARSARQMVANPDAFGTANVAGIGNVPDWFASVLPKGVTAGAVREQFPPRVTQDNPVIEGLGNILMV